MALQEPGAVLFIRQQVSVTTRELTAHTAHHQTDQDQTDRHSLKYGAEAEAGGFSVLGMVEYLDE